jgi:hypothetical protein
VFGQSLSQKDQQLVEVAASQLISHAVQKPQTTQTVKSAAWSVQTKKNNQRFDRQTSCKLFTTSGEKALVRALVRLLGSQEHLWSLQGQTRDNIRDKVETLLKKGMTAREAPSERSTTGRRSVKKQRDSRVGFALGAMDATVFGPGQERSCCYVQAI